MRAEGSLPRLGFDQERTKGSAPGSDSGSVDEILGRKTGWRASSGHPQIANRVVELAMRQKPEVARGAAVLGRPIFFTILEGGRQLDCDAW